MRHSVIYLSNKYVGVQRALDFQASQALDYQASSQAKPMLDFEVQASLPTLSVRLT